MLNVLVATEHEIVYLDVTHCFYSHNFVTNNIQVRTSQDLIHAGANTTLHVAIVDFPTKIPFTDIVEACKSNNPDCLIYGIFDELNEILISEFIHAGAYSFALKSNLQGLADSLRAALAERDSRSMHLSQPAFLNAFFEQALDPIWVKDKRGKYLYINPAGARFISKPVREIIGKYDHDVFPQETAEKISKSDNYVIQTGRTQVVEDTLSNCQEINRIFQAVKTVFRDGSGKTQGIIGTIRDITDRKQGGITHQETERHMNMMLQNIKGAALSFIDH